MNRKIRHLAGRTAMLALLAACVSGPAWASADPQLPADPALRDGGVDEQVHDQIPAKNQARERMQPPQQEVVARPDEGREVSGAVIERDVDVLGKAGDSVVSLRE